MENYLKRFSLTDKNAFITGACGILGCEISKALASAGAKTVLLDINSEKGEKLKAEIRNAGYNADFEFFDITKIQDIETQCENLYKTYNQIDVWVNCAYPRTTLDRSNVSESIEKITMESLQDNIQMHLISTTWLCKIVGLIMKKNNSGSIINMSSIYGVVGNDFTIYEDMNMTTPMYYPVIKGGINSLTRYLASYFGTFNVRVNSVCPGGILNNQKREFVEKYSQRTPMCRMGTSIEIASSVLFLASEASSYITGSILMVDGGWTSI